MCAVSGPIIRYVSAGARIRTWVGTKPTDGSCEHFIDPL